MEPGDERAGFVGQEISWHNGRVGSCLNPLADPLTKVMLDLSQGWIQRKQSETNLGLLAGWGALARPIYLGRLPARSGTKPLIDP
jgi:hypothetical protein